MNELVAALMTPSQSNNAIHAHSIAGIINRVPTPPVAHSEFDRMARDRPNSRNRVDHSGSANQDDRDHHTYTAGGWESERPNVSDCSTPEWDASQASPQNTSTAVSLEQFQSLQTQVNGLVSALTPLHTEIVSNIQKPTDRLPSLLLAPNEYMMQEHDLPKRETATEKRSISVKWYHNGRFRRFRIDLPESSECAYATLLTEMQEMAPNSNFEGPFAWQDADGDLIMFATNKELKEALHNMSDNVLRIFTIKQMPDGHDVIAKEEMTNGKQQIKQKCRQLEKAIAERDTELAHCHGQRERLEAKLAGQGSKLEQARQRRHKQELLVAQKELQVQELIERAQQVEQAALTEKCCHSFKDSEAPCKLSTELPAIHQKKNEQDGLMDIQMCALRETGDQCAQSNEELFLLTEELAQCINGKKLHEEQLSWKQEQANPWKNCFRGRKFLKGKVM